MTNTTTTPPSLDQQVQYTSKGGVTLGAAIVHIWPDGPVDLVVTDPSIPEEFKVDRVRYLSYRGSSPPNTAMSNPKFGLGFDIAPDGTILPVGLTLGGELAWVVGSVDNPPLPPTASFPIVDNAMSLGVPSNRLAMMFMYSNPNISGTALSEPVSGATVSIAVPTALQIIMPAGPLAALTIALPAAAADGETHEVVITQPVAALSFTSPLGVPLGVPSATFGYASFTLRYIQSQGPSLADTWVLIENSSAQNLSAYLEASQAAALYLTSAAAASTYITAAQAAAAFITLAEAEADFLTPAQAAAAYITASQAAAAFLTASEANAAYAPLIAPTFQNTVTIDGQYVTIAGPSGSFKRYTTNTGSLPTWEWGASNAAQSGSNVGSDFEIWAMSDAGAALFKALEITRATGVMALAERPTFNGNLAWDAGNFVPTNYQPAGSYLTTSVAASTYAPLSGAATIAGEYTFEVSPQVPTAAINDASENSANTEFVQTAINNGIGLPFDVVRGYAGPMPPVALTANQVLFTYVSNRDVYLIPAYTVIQMLTTPTAPVTLQVTLYGPSTVVLGTVTIATNGGVTWNLSGNYNNDLPVSRGASLVIQAPASPDATLAGLSITMTGFNTATIGH